jgi:hypothetical protein
MVGRARNELSGGNRQMQPTRTVERNGKTYEQNTANIGKGKREDKPALG